MLWVATRSDWSLKAGYGDGKRVFDGTACGVARRLAHAEVLYVGHVSRRVCGHVHRHVCRYVPRQASCVQACAQGCAHRCAWACVMRGRQDCSSMEQACM